MCRCRGGSASIGRPTPPGSGCVGRAAGGWPGRATSAARAGRARRSAGRAVRASTDRRGSLTVRPSPGTSSRRRGRRRRRSPWRCRCLGGARTRAIRARRRRRQASAQASRPTGSRPPPRRVSGLEPPRCRGRGTWSTSICRRASRSGPPQATHTPVSRALCTAWHAEQYPERVTTKVVPQCRQRSAPSAIVSAHMGHGMTAVLTGAASGHRPAHSRTVKYLQADALRG